MKRAKTKVFAVLFALVLYAVGANGALAVEAEEYGAKYLKSDDPSMLDVDIINFKVELYEQGFYSAGVADSTLQARELDDLTMAAVKQVCNYNPELTYYADGVSNELYWRVMGISGDALKTPLDEVYSQLAPGAENDAVARAQNRLNQLGYDAVGAAFTPGLYDDAFQQVIDAFVRCNKFVYEREQGFTVEMQELLFSDAALPYSPEEDASLSEKILGYLSASGSVLGIRMSNAALWAIGFALLCVIVVLVLKLCAPGGEGRSKRGAADRKVREDEVRFEIEYGSERCTRIVSKKRCVRIGRATGDFPLNMADDSISRKHCEIYCENGVMMLRDFSSFGTHINRELCHHSQHVLRSGDVIEIGRHRVTIHF